LIDEALLHRIYTPEQLAEKNERETKGEATGAKIPLAKNKKTNILLFVFY